MILPSSCYSLEAVAKRWNCDVKTLLLLACDGAVAIALLPEIDGKFYYVPNPRDFLRAKPEERVEVTLVCATPEAARGIIRDDSGSIITDADLDDMPYEERKKTLRKFGRANMLRLEDNQFTVTELVITQAELERFECNSTSNSDTTNKEPASSAIRPRKKQKRVRNPGSFFDTVATIFENMHKRTPTVAELWTSLQVWGGAEIVEKNGREIKLHDGTVADLTKLTRWYRDVFTDD